jgi:hypothetical protein
LFERGWVLAPQAVGVASASVLARVAAKQIGLVPEEARFRRINSRIL